MATIARSQPVFFSLSPVAPFRSSSCRLVGRSMLPRGSFSSAVELPMPGFNPDSFITPLLTVPDVSPEVLVRHSTANESVKLIHARNNPVGAVPAPAVRKKKIVPSDGRTSRRRHGPPDLPSILLHKRIVYIGMPLVSAVSELVISQLMYLDRDAPKRPISLYINSTGTTRDDGEIVALEQDGFAIYDTLMRMRCQIKTVALGYAMGHACLLLASGTKGKRFMFPNSTVTIQEPKVLPSGLLPTSDVLVRAQEARINRDIFVELFAKHTGNPVELVAENLKKPFTLDAMEAKEFGIVDKILCPGDLELVRELLPRARGIKKPPRPRNGVFQNWFASLYKPRL